MFFLKLFLQVDKILLATKELTLDKLPGQDRPQAINFVAGVGKETVKFDTPVRLVGKAESYLQSLLKAQIFALSRCLGKSVTSYPQLQRLQWVMQKDAKQEPVDPAQIILLVALIDFVKQVNLNTCTMKPSPLFIGNYYIFL